MYYTHQHTMPPLLDIATKHRRRSMARLILFCCLSAALLLLSAPGAHAAGNDEPEAETLLLRVDGREAHIDPASIELRIRGRGDSLQDVDMEAFKDYIKQREVSNVAEYVYEIIGDEDRQPLNRVNARVSEAPRTGELGVELENFSSLLARGPRFICIGIPGWWEICFWTEWESARHPQVTVDGRLVNLLEAEATLRAREITVGQAMDGIGPGPHKIAAEHIDVFHEDGRPMNVEGLHAAIEGSDIGIQGLGPTLARSDHPLQICITIGEYVICVNIEIDWAEDVERVIEAHPQVTVDGNRVHAGVPTAELDGDGIDYARALEILGREPVSTTAIVVTTPEGEKLELPDVHAHMRDNHIAFSGLAGALARYSFLDICLEAEKDKVRIYITIGWAHELEPVVTVDAREVLVGEPEVTLEGRPLDFHRAVTVLGREAITTSDLEIRTRAGEPVAAENALAVVRGHQFALRGLSNLITIHGELEVCITIAGMEFCIPIIIGKEKEPQVHLNGREVMSYNARAWIDDEEVDPAQAFTLIERHGLTDITAAIDGFPQIAAGSQVEMEASVDGNQIFVEGFDRGFWPGGRDRVEICIGAEIPPLGSVYICIDITDWIYPILGQRGQVELPAHRVHGNIELRYTDHPEPIHPIPEGKVALDQFSVTAEDEFGNPVLYLDQPYTMTVELLEEVLENHAGRLQPQSIQLVVWDVDEDVWRSLSQTSYTSVETPLVTGLLDHFSDFAVLAELHDDPDDEPASMQIYLPFAQR